MCPKSHKLVDGIVDDAEKNEAADDDGHGDDDDNFH